ncbi:hypothetical protein SUGI_0512580 [Cryptomeria japonica]|nr:hypothetical protein SUGI_0512580 [Cryptomeria japonica]
MASEKKPVNARKKHNIKGDKSFKSSDLGFHAKQKEAEDTSDTGVSGYCSKCWLYGHKNIDCRQRIVRAQPDYDHWKPFIAEQKRRSLEDDKLAIDTQVNKAKDLRINKLPGETRASTRSKFSEQDSFQLPKVFTVSNLDGQITRFAKTKYALQKTSLPGIERTPKFRFDPVKCANEPHSALGRSGFFVSEEDPRKARSKDYEWQEIKRYKKARSQKVGRIEIPLRNSFDLLKKKENALTKIQYSPFHRRPGALGSKGNFRVKRTVNENAAQFHTTPSFSRRLGQGVNIAQDNLKSPTISGKHYTPPHRRENGLIVRWKGVGASNLDIIEALAKMLPREDANIYFLSDRGGFTFTDIDDCFTKTVLPQPISDPPCEPSFEKRITNNQLISMESSPPTNMKISLQLSNPLINNNDNPQKLAQSGGFLTPEKERNIPEITENVLPLEPIALSNDMNSPTKETLCTKEDLICSQITTPPMKSIQASPSEDEKCSKEVKIITDYIGKMLPDELLDLFISEIVDEEELEYQKEVLIQEIMSLRNSREDNDDTIEMQQEVIEVQKVDLSNNTENVINSVEHEALEVKEDGIELEKEYDEEAITNFPDPSSPAGDNVDILDGLFGITNEDRQLGIATNLAGLSSPKIDKVKKKRGRKSCIALRSLAGNAENQMKISDILNSGKGKSLPKEQ